MKPAGIVGIILIAIGILALAYGGFSYTTREKVIDAVVQRLDLPRKHALDAYTMAEQHETNPRSVWGYVQGLTRLSQHTPWQDMRFTLDRAAGRLLATVH